MRYLLHLAYNGTHFAGYQIQPNVRTVQDEIEKAISLLLRSKTAVVGCGRTDTGVHSHSYYLHFDTNVELPHNFIYKLNGVLEKDIVIYSIKQSEIHARFDATYRKYIYKISTIKTPFTTDTVYNLYQARGLDIDLLNLASHLLLDYTDFNTFCKSGHQSFTTNCTLFESYWQFSKDKNELEFHISANRFLRGMVRLIVGMCLHVAQDKISLRDVKEALENKARLKRDYSVPAHGLSLVEVRYGG